MDLLPDAIRHVHDGQGRLELSGLAQIDTMPGLLPGLICTLMGLPRPGRNVPVTVIIDSTPRNEHWHRRFGNQRYASRLTAGTGATDGLLIERLGMITNIFRVEAVGTDPCRSLISPATAIAPYPQLGCSVPHAGHAGDSAAAG